MRRFSHLLLIIYFKIVLADDTVEFAQSLKKYQFFWDLLLLKYYALTTGSPALLT